ATPAERPGPPQCPRGPRPTGQGDAPSQRWVPPGGAGDRSGLRGRAAARRAGQSLPGSGSDGGRRDRGRRIRRGLAPRRRWRDASEGPARALGIRRRVGVPIGRVPEAVRALEDGGSAVGEGPAVGGRAGSGVLTATWSAPEPAPPDRLPGLADALGRLRATV